MEIFRDITRDSNIGYYLVSKGWKKLATDNWFDPIDKSVLTLQAAFELQKKRDGAGEEK